MLSSYPWNLMTVYFLQHRQILPSLQDGAPVEIFEQGEERYNVGMKDVSEISPDSKMRADRVTLKSFLNFYECEFDFERDVVSVRLGRPCSIQDCEDLYVDPSEQKFLKIEDPFNTSRNLAHAVNQDAFKAGFDQGWRAYVQPFRSNPGNAFSWTKEA